jgi:type VI secretion system ImpM family protein
MSGSGYGSRGSDGAGVGIYGKLATQPDFFRSNAGEFSQAGLDRWFQEAMETVRNDRTTLPAEPVGFLLAPAGGKQAFAGAFVPSADAAGRAFPLALFATISSEAVDLASDFPSLASRYAGFVESAGLIASGGVALPGSELVERAESLPLPGQDRGWSGSVAASLAEESAQSLRDAVGGTPSGLSYAMRTFCTACDQAAKTGPVGRGAITVDAPAPNPLARALWLELAQRRLRWHDAAPSMLWTEGDAGRLLLTLGEPSPSAFGYLANPRHRSPRFWPLRTDVVPAIEQAVKALTHEQRRRVENPRVSLGELLSGFA